MGFGNQAGFATCMTYISCLHVQEQGKHYNVINQPLWKNVCHNFECRYEMLPNGTSVRVLGPSLEQVDRARRQGIKLTGYLAIDDGDVVLLPDQGVQCYPRVTLEDVSTTSDLTKVVYRGTRPFSGIRGPLASYALPVGCHVEVAVTAMDEERMSVVLAAILALGAEESIVDSTFDSMPYDTFVTLDRPGTQLFDDAISVGGESESSITTITVAIPDVSTAKCRWSVKEEVLSANDIETHSLSQGRHAVLMLRLEYDMYAKPTLAGCKRSNEYISCNATFVSIAKDDEYWASAAYTLEKLVLWRYEHDPGFMHRAAMNATVDDLTQDIVAHRATCMQAAVAMVGRANHLGSPCRSVLTFVRCRSCAMSIA